MSRKVLLKLIRSRETARKFFSLFTALALIFQNGAIFLSPAYANNGGYSVGLTSPTPPASDTSFTWEISGSSPGAGQEISHIDIYGCWGANDVAGASATAGSIEYNGVGHAGHVTKTDGLVTVDGVQDSDLPLSVTITFNQSYPSDGSATGFVKTGGGPDVGSPSEVGGPNCEVPPEPSCGNGVPEEGEECDDGNTEDGDGCSADCTIEITCDTCGPWCEEECEGDPGCILDCMSGVCPEGCDLCSTCKPLCEEACEGNPWCTLDCVDGVCPECLCCEDCGSLCEVGCEGECEDDPWCMIFCPLGCREEFCPDCLEDSCARCLFECGDDLECMEEECPECLTPCRECVFYCGSECGDDPECMGECVANECPECSFCRECESFADDLCSGNPSCKEFFMTEVCSNCLVCGNGYIGPGEECDDGNTNNGDGCSATCQIEPGSITLRKHTIPSGSSQIFDVSVWVGPLSEQVLIGTMHLADGLENTFSNLAARDYAVNEVVPLGWSLTGVTCTGEEVFVNGETVNLSPGEDIICEFTNTQFPQLTVTKIVINDNGGDRVVADFPLYVNGILVTSGLENVFPPGQYTISEGGLLGYTATIGGDCASDGSITLPVGDVKFCTITNDDQFGRIIVDKVTDPSGDSQSFDFTLTGGPSSLNQSFSLTDGATPYDSGSIIPGTGYSLTETLPTGWDLTSATCDDGSLVTNIDVSPEETVTCTFTNTKRGSIGDFIWTDTDGDKVQDAGEAGIAGVTVNLYRDDGDGVFEPDGDDASASPLATTVTDASGLYLFSNLVMGDYWVDVDATTLPAGLVITTANDPLLVPLSVGANEQGADFGYKKKGEVLGEKTVLAATGASPSVLVFDLVMLGIGILLRIYSKRLRRVPAGTRLRRRKANA